jgi:DNA polymerase III subunit epsilon
MDIRPKQRYLFLDTETTGLDPDTNEVIEIAALVMEQANDEEKPKEVSRYSCKLRADTGIVDLGALAVNGRKLTEDVLTDEIISGVQKQLIYGFADFLATYVSPTTFIIGANINFDIDFCKALFKKHGIDAGRLLNKKQAVDVQQIARFLHDANIVELPDFRLSTLVREILQTKWNQHNAMDDVLITAKLYFTMREIA